MSKLIIHAESNPEGIELRRLKENLELTPMERLEKAFYLMHLAMVFKRGPIKEPQGKGVVLRKKQNNLP